MFWATSLGTTNVGASQFGATGFKLHVLRLHFSVRPQVSGLQVIDFMTLMLHSLRLQVLSYKS